jgi:hypothetical protein
MARRKIIPKRIGAVKVPKRLRKLGDRVLADILSDPRSREVAASLLLSLGAALASRAAPQGSVFRDIFDHPVRTAKAAEAAGAESARKAGETAGGVAAAVGQIVSEVVGEAVEAIRRDFGRKVRPERPDPAPNAAPEAEEDRFH